MADMSKRIVHHQRLAWDCARAFVALIDDDRDCAWLLARTRELLGADYELALSDARARLLWGGRRDAASIEAGLWRARVEDLLAERPGLSPALESLVEAARTRAAQPYAYR